jgi:hypothetical protein
MDEYPITVPPPSVPGLPMGHPMEHPEEHISTRRQQEVNHLGKEARGEGREHRANRASYFEKRASGRRHP